MRNSSIASSWSGSQVFDHGHVGAGPVGAGVVVAVGGGHEEVVVRDLDVVPHLLPRDAGRHQADRGRAAVVELQVLEHASAFRWALRVNPGARARAVRDKNEKPDGQLSLPAIVVRASIRLPRSPRVRKR